MQKNDKEIIIEKTKEEFKYFLHDIIDTITAMLMVVIALITIFILISAPIYFGTKYLTGGGSLSIYFIAFMIYSLILMIVYRFAIMIIRIFNNIKK